MADQKPSVGRIVHYQSHGSPNGQHKSEPRAAIITKVYDIESWPPGTVDLCVINPTGLYFDQHTMFSDSPEAGRWNWPPRIA
jgi:hypothetical protein